MTSSAYNVAQGYNGLGRSSQADKLNRFLYQNGEGLSIADRAWCADFVNASLRDSGGKGTGSGAARSFLNWGKPTSAPNPGDIAVFSRNGNGWQGHVGFYQGRNPDGSIKVFGGNQSGGVNTSSYPSERLLGFRTAGTPQLAPKPSVNKADPGLYADPVGYRGSTTSSPTNMPDGDIDEQDRTPKPTQLPNYYGADRAAGREAERTVYPSGGAGQYDNRSAPAPARPTGNGQPQWVNGTYGQGIQWGNGDTQFMNGGGSFKAGSLTDKPKPPVGGGLAGSGVSTSQAPAANWFKGLFGG